MGGGVALPTTSPPSAPLLQRGVVEHLAQPPGLLQHRRLLGCGLELILEGLADCARSRRLFVHLVCGPALALNVPLDALWAHLACCHDVSRHAPLVCAAAAGRPARDCWTYRLGIPRKGVRPVTACYNRGESVACSVGGAIPCS